MGVRTSQDLAMQHARQDHIPAVYGRPRYFSKGMPAEALPMALLRPLSGSGAYGILASVINDPAIGPDSYIGYLVSTLQGSTETTFYVLAVYFGAVQIRRVRHALAAALTADVCAVFASIAICKYLYG